MNTPTPIGAQMNEQGETLYSVNGSLVYARSYEQACAKLRETTRVYLPHNGYGNATNLFD